MKGRKSVGGKNIWSHIGATGGPPGISICDTLASLFLEPLLKMLHANLKYEIEYIKVHVIGAG